MKGTFRMVARNVRGRNAGRAGTLIAEAVTDSFGKSRTFFIEGRPIVTGREVEFTGGYLTKTGDASDVRRKAVTAAKRVLPAGATIAFERVA
jgi:hypothetical protein